MAKLLFRPKPYKKESFTGYLMRLGYENFSSGLDVWRLYKREKSHDPILRLSKTLDKSPYTNVDVVKMAIELGLTESELQQLTFINIFKKFGIEKEKYQKTQILLNLIESTRCYCPECIKNDEYFKLIWQVREITFCPLHSCEVLSCCPQCSNAIPILDNVNSPFLCNNCSFDLRKSKSISCDISDDKLLRHSIWNELMYSSNSEMIPLDGLSIKQSIAVKIIAIENGVKFNSEFMTCRSQNIRQIARDTQSKSMHVHLSLIIDTLHKSNLTIEEFFRYIPPTDVIQKITEKRIGIYNEYACLAPWCESYQVIGSLVRTENRHQASKFHPLYKNYMYCSKCSVRYCIDTEINEFIENGYFIGLGWSRLMEELEVDISLSEMAKKINSTRDRTLRMLVFFYTNGINRERLKSISLPVADDEEKLEQIMDLITEGSNGKKIIKNLNLTYNEFLYYWEKKAVRIHRFETHRKRMAKGKNG